MILGERKFIEAAFDPEEELERSFLAFVRSFLAFVHVASLMVLLR